MADAVLVALGAVAVMANAYAYYEYKISKESLESALQKQGKQKLDKIKAETTTTFDDLFEKPRSTDYGMDAAYEKKSLESAEVFPNPFMLPSQEQKARKELNKLEQDYIEFKKIRGMEEVEEKTKPIEKKGELTEIKLGKISSAPILKTTSADSKKPVNTLQRVNEIKQEIARINKLFLADKIDEETYCMLLEEKERELTQLH